MRREIGLFLAITAALTGALIAVVLAEDVDIARLDDASALGQLALFGQAFVPGVAALAARFLTTGGVRGLGLRLGETRRYALVAYAAPVTATAVAYAIVWGSGAGGFDPDELGPAALGLTLGVAPFLVLALGEEIGWRGLMAHRLTEVTTLPRVALWTGLAWSAFHLPLMLFVPGAVEGVPMLYGVAVFTIGLIALSYPMAWLRERSGSVWAPTLMHAAGNAALYFAFDPLTTDTGSTEWFAGETGIVLTLSLVALAYSVVTPSIDVMRRKAW